MIYISGHKDFMICFLISSFRILYSQKRETQSFTSLPSVAHKTYLLQLRFPNQKSTKHYLTMFDRLSDNRPKHLKFRTVRGSPRLPPKPMIPWADSKDSTYSPIPDYEAKSRGNQAQASKDPLPVP